MNLSKLPVLIRTEVSAAAKSAGLPAVYSRALVALEEAVEELSFAKLKTVEISAEGLAAWAKAHQDEKLTKTARELKFRTRRTANYIAEQLVKLRKADFVDKGGHRGGVGAVLRGAGYSNTEVERIRTVARAPDDPNFAHMSDTALKYALRGSGGRKVHSQLYHLTFGGAESGRSPLARSQWFRNNNARSLAVQFTDITEAEKARNTVTLIKAWCDEFLKNLPRTVSKAKVEK